MVLTDSHNSFLENAWFIFSCHGSLVCHTPRMSVQSKAHIYTSSSIYLILFVFLWHTTIIRTNMCKCNFVSSLDHDAAQIQHDLRLASTTGFVNWGDPLVNWQNAVFKVVPSVPLSCRPSSKTAHMWSTR